MVWLYLAGSACTLSCDGLRACDILCQVCGAFGGRGHSSPGRPQLVVLEDGDPRKPRSPQSYSLL